MKTNVMFIIIYFIVKVSTHRGNKWTWRYIDECILLNRKIFLIYNSKSTIEGMQLNES